MAGKAAKAEAAKSQPLELVIERNFAAPRALVWQAWTNPDMLHRWTAPRELSVADAESDIRVGGRYRVVMQEDNGKQYRLRGEYKELTPIERIVFTHVWVDADGRDGEDSLCTVTLSERGPQATHMRFHQIHFASAASRDGHGEGWASCFGLLDDLLAEQTQ